GRSLFLVFLRALALQFESLSFGSLHDQFSPGQALDGGRLFLFLVNDDELVSVELVLRLLLYGLVAFFEGENGLAILGKFRDGTLRVPRRSFDDLQFPDQ